MTKSKNLKIQAAEEAVGRIQSGMVVGIGEGSTVMFAVEALARRVKDGELSDILCVTASMRMTAAARNLNLSITGFAIHTDIDLTIDGADEVDPKLNLIKGGGGALLREKILAQASAYELIIVDESKLSDQLGAKWPVPLEVIPYGSETQIPFLESLGATVKRRKHEDGAPFRTDQGNMILDANFGPIEDARELANRLDARVGIVEHGLFLGYADEVIVASQSGVRTLRKSDL